MKVLIVTNGTISSTEYLATLAHKHDKVICADGAVRYFRKADILPSYVVGDLDSIDERDLQWVKEKRVPVIQFNTKKDASDTEIAVRYALNENASVIKMTGTLGSRIDHGLGNIFLLKLIMDHGVQGMIVENNTEIQLVQSNTVFYWDIGDTVSFIPISTTIHDMSLVGFEYPLSNETLTMGSSRTLSNIVVEKEQEVRLNEGILLAIRNK